MKIFLWILAFLILAGAGYFAYVYFTKKSLIDKLILQCANENVINDNDLCEIGEASRPELMKKSISFLRALLSGEIH